jgi:curved DNA-binding protein CbpA
MNGQLSENPLPELIRELSSKNLSGRLRLEFEKVKGVVYFKSGSVIYAACNVRSLRLGEYLVKHKLLSEDELLHLGARTSDFDLARTLISEKRFSRNQADEIMARQVSDVLRLALLWTEGTWEFDNRSHLSEEVTFQLDVASLLLEAGRRLPPKFTASRFRNPTESFTLLPVPPAISLSPTEVFVLSRIDFEITLSDLIAVSGQPEFDAMRIIYSLSLAGFIKRSSWKPAFREVEDKTQTEKTTTSAPEVEPQPTQQDTVESFLVRMAASETHYAVLGVEAKATMSELKSAYYDIARKYHPDRFRNSEGDLLARVESAFARITQAYDTLRDPGLRATYDSKLDAQVRASQLAKSAPKATQKPQDADSETPQQKDEPRTTLAQQAEAQFKEGFAALELRQRNVAIGLLGSAARSMPDEPRFRAYYGRALALHESTRRLAEAELQAAVKLEPQNAEYRIMLAELYRDLGFIVRAKGEAERAVASDRNNQKARDLLRSLNLPSA